MPEMKLPFELIREGQVVLLFQGQFGAFSSTAGARAIIRLVIDGVTVGSAAAVGNDHGVDVQTFGYNAFASLPAGPHVAQVLWHTFPLGATSCVEERSLHSPAPVNRHQRPFAPVSVPVCAQAGRTTLLESRLCDRPPWAAFVLQGDWR